MSSILGRQGSALTSSHYPKPKSTFSTPGFKNRVGNGAKRAANIDSEGHELSSPRQQEKGKGHAAPSFTSEQSCPRKRYEANFFLRKTVKKKKD